MTQRRDGTGMGMARRWGLTGIGVVTTAVTAVTLAGLAVTLLTRPVPARPVPARPVPARPVLPVSSAALTRASTPAYTPPGRMLEEGDQGSDVTALQRRLEALHYYPGAVNGVFGADTLEAVWAFQEVQGLSADGEVGPRTARALVHPRSYQPRYPNVATRIEVNLRVRVLVLYKNYSVVLISHISAGGGYYFCDPGGGCGYAITPTGAYKTTTSMPGWVTVALGEMYNPVFFIGTVYAIHGDTDVPLAPVSHGCVRVPMDVAAFFPTLVGTPGTPVYVYSAGL